MRVYKGQVVISLVGVLIGMSVLMMLTYIYDAAVTGSTNPFYMTKNYRVMKKNTAHKISFDDIIDLNEDMDILVISRYKDKPILGIYDPAMIMPFQNTYVSPGTTRYFSSSDYKNKTKAGIIIFEHLTGELALDKTSVNPYIDDILYGTNSEAYSL